MKPQRPLVQAGGEGEHLGTRDANPTIRFRPSAIRAIEPMQFGWPELVIATAMPRRTIEKLISSGEFPRPTRYVGKRPYWLPSVVRQWVEGGES